MSALYRSGVVLLGVLSVIDLTSPLYTDGQHPPMIIAVIGSVLGLISIVLAVLAWRGRVGAAVGLCVVRVLSALTALPAFWVTGVPGPVMAVAGTFMVLSIVGVVLTLAGLRRPVPVSALCCILAGCSWAARSSRSLVLCCRQLDLLGWRQRCCVVPDRRHP